MDAYRAEALAGQGDEDAAREILQDLESRRESETVLDADLALICLALRDNDTALHYLERAYFRRESRMIWLGVAQEFDPLREDPRFQDLIAKMDYGFE